MRCKKPIVDKTELLILQKEKFHAYHFSCASCSRNLDAECKDLDGKLYCPPCYNKGAWRRTVVPASPPAPTRGPLERRSRWSCWAVGRASQPWSQRVRRAAGPTKVAVSPPWASSTIRR